MHFVEDEKLPDDVVVQSHRRECRPWNGFENEHFASTPLRFACWQFSWLVILIAVRQTNQLVTLIGPDFG